MKDIELLDDTVEAPIAPKHIWVVINGLKAPVLLTYGGHAKTLGAGGRWYITNKDQLGPLPSGVRCIPFVK